MRRWPVMLIAALLAVAAGAAVWTLDDDGDGETVRPIEIVPSKKMPDDRSRGRREPDRRPDEPRFRPAPPPPEPPPAAQPAPSPPAPQPAPSPPPADDDDDDDGDDDDGGDDDGDDGDDGDD